MTLFVQNDATGAGAGGVDAQQAAVDLGVATNGDTGLGLAAQVGDRQQVTYARTDPGLPAIRVDGLVNTNFNLNPQGVDIVIIPVLANFTLNDGRSILTIAGTALPPSGSPLPGSTLNNTNSCLVIYDTTQNSGTGWCAARAGTNGTLDLPISNPVLLFHELSHAFRIATNAQLQLTGVCDPSSAEEAAAINDENQLRTQIATAQGVTAVLRDPGIHCGGSCAPGTVITCCIVATVASGSPISAEVAALRAIRDRYVRPTEVGHAFFESLHRDYYSFSPGVATAAAGDRELRSLLLEGFVRPLIVVLGLIERYSLKGDSPTALGKQFAAAHADHAGAEARLAAFWSFAESPAALVRIDSRLGSLVLDRALRSSHVMWALWEPVLLYYRVLERHVAGDDASAIGFYITASIAHWAGDLPVEAIWGSLTSAQAAEELAILERTLLREPISRARFRARLGQHFGQVTSVARLLN